jgi:hypothetical protein
MSEDNDSLIQRFSVDQLAGSLALVLGAVGGLLAVIFKSRCFCRFRIGLGDKCYLCACERKPPPDPPAEEEEKEEKEEEEETVLPKTTSKPKEEITEPEPESPKP